MSLDSLQKQLRAAGNPKDALFLQGFFKTGPGQYAEGDVFLGIRVPVTRKLARQSDELTLAEVETLLQSQYHEERLLALLILVRRYERADEPLREKLVRLYTRSTRFINNWDLVDLSAPNLLGHWLLTRPRGLLYEWVKSPNLWKRRIAVLSTLAFIRNKQFDDTLAFCRILLQERHDLMHKACGWMLREIGKREERVLVQFLEQHAQEMPRTMLRYAIERFPEKQRQAYLKKRAGGDAQAKKEPLRRA